MYFIASVLIIIFVSASVPVLFFFGGILLASLLTKTFAIRKLYLNTLLKIFEYVQKNIDKYSEKTSAETENGSKCDNNLKPVVYCSENFNENSTDTKRNNLYIKDYPKIIIRNEFILLPDPQSEPNNNIVTNYEKLKEKNENSVHRLENSNMKNFELSDILNFVRSGVEAVIEDQLTPRLQSVELKAWNLLTRTNKNYIFIHWKITLIWLIGFMIRYLFLLPLRCTMGVIGISWLLICTTMISIIPKCQYKIRLNECVFRTFFQIWSGLCFFIIHHNIENKPKHGICVANHTAPIDCIAIIHENYYSLIGQRFNGVMGTIQRAFSRVSTHVWFERDVVEDRKAVVKRMREHILNLNNPPIVIFPEGTGTNNTAILQFRKGSFEVGSVIHPIAIKYDPRFGDPFWNHVIYSIVRYGLMVMTSWAIVCDVWFLPSMAMYPTENASQFAARVKKVIAVQAELIEINWDGRENYLKTRQKWVKRQQEEIFKKIQV